MRPFLIAAAATMFIAGPAASDDVTDAIESALQAYKDGDRQYALEELAYATQLLKAMKTEDLSAFLPEAPDGWSREVDTEFAAGMAFMGGGVGASAEYSGGGERFSVTLMADNPMVASMAPMLANAGLMGGRMIRVGREKFVAQDDEIMGLVGNRILIQVSGGNPDLVVQMLEGMDFAALASFGS
ncbi:MAG: hypothetical protein QNI90_17310 [Dinoroseobacter sp.]|nr:hypothetical protein [Dinoroseobacter sp.]